MSLAKHVYYGNPQNDFWRLVGGAFDIDMVGMDYDERISTILSKKVSIWDVVHDGTREDSRDDTIIVNSYNDLNGLISDNPDINIVLLNGKKAGSLFHNGIKPSLNHDVVVHCLPSSSSANRINLKERAAEWKKWLTIETPL
jgi:hypoxanthine-DNA glycosylase